MITRSRQSCFGMFEFRFGRFMRRIGFIGRVFRLLVRCVGVLRLRVFGLLMRGFLFLDLRVGVQRFRCGTAEFDHACGTRLLVVFLREVRAADLFGGFVVGFFGSFFVFGCGQVLGKGVRLLRGQIMPHGRGFLRVAGGFGRNVFYFFDSGGRIELFVLLLSSMLRWSSVLKTPRLGIFDGASRGRRSVK